MDTGYTRNSVVPSSYYCFMTRDANLEVESNHFTMLRDSVDQEFG